MNWTTVLEDLRNRGWTQSALSARLGIAQSALSELANGKTTDPKFKTGDALRALHASGKKYKPAKAAA